MKFSGERHGNEGYETPFGVLIGAEREAFCGE